MTDLLHIPCAYAVCDLVPLSAVQYNSLHQHVDLLFRPIILWRFMFWMNYLEYLQLSTRQWGIPLNSSLCIPVVISELLRRFVWKHLLELAPILSIIISIFLKCTQEILVLLLGPLTSLFSAINFWLWWIIKNSFYIFLRAAQNFPRLLWLFDLLVVFLDLMVLPGANSLGYLEEMIFVAFDCSD